MKSECVILEVNDSTDIVKYRGKLHDKVVLMPQCQRYELSFRPMARRYADEELKAMTKDSRPYAPWGSWSSKGNGGRLTAAIDSLLKDEEPLAVIVGDGNFNVPGSRGVNYKVGQPEPVPEIV